MCFATLPLPYAGNPKRFPSASQLGRLLEEEFAVSPLFKSFRKFHNSSKVNLFR